MSNLIRTTFFWNKLDQIRTKTKRLQSQIIFKVLGAIKQKDLNRDSESRLRLSFPFRGEF